MLLLREYLLRAQVGSRRDCTTLIEAGRVKVNGKVVRSAHHMVDDASDRITLDDTEVKADFSVPSIEDRVKSEIDDLGISLEGRASSKVEDFDTLDIELALANDPKATPASARTTEMDSPSEFHLDLDDLDDLSVSLASQLPVDLSAMKMVLSSISSAAAPLAEALINGIASAAGENLGIEQKRALVKIINSQCREVNLCLKHPDTGEPCTLLAVSDRYDGSFVLEDRKTKKRTRSARQIKSMLPFQLIPIPYEA